ncbi:MAG: hypothetical protein VZR28_11225 [Candidatus Cryptobacteroides sp.]|nr:hypothetical protein [Candidatus Cryptobacteroides sp.]
MARARLFIGTGQAVQWHWTGFSVARARLHRLPPLGGRSSGKRDGKTGLQDILADVSANMSGVYDKMSLFSDQMAPECKWYVD